MKVRIAYFITSHGFGHAARSIAIMKSLNNLNPEIAFDIFTTVPEWFFSNSCINNFNYHKVETEVGMVQRTALREDLGQTIKKLEQYFPLNHNLIFGVTRKIRELKSKLIICDIAPLGIAVSKSTGIQSVLVENFTWDWIYENYKYKSSKLDKHINYLKNLYLSVDYRVRTNPVCSEAKSDIITHPVSRKPRTDLYSTRKKLNADQDKPLVMITMGGIPSEYVHHERLLGLKHINFILTGISDRFMNKKNLILIPHNSPFFHPDLVNASDAVVGKLGYSTLSEIYNSGKAFCYVTRQDFPESPYLENYVQQEMAGLRISASQFESDSWINRIDDLLSISKITYKHTNGSELAAEFIHNIIVQ